MTFILKSRSLMCFPLCVSHQVWWVFLVLIVSTCSTLPCVFIVGGFPCAVPVQHVFLQRCSISLVTPINQVMCSCLIFSVLIFFLWICVFYVLCPLQSDFQFCIFWHTLSSLEWFCVNTFIMKNYFNLKLCFWVTNLGSISCPSRDTRPAGMLSRSNPEAWNCTNLSEIQ